MEKIIQEIDANGFRYLSQIPEFKEGLPFGILNKVITDVGGTFAALNCDCNYIVVTPTIDLVQSILADINIKNKVFGLYGGVPYTDFRDYIFDNDIHKIAVTYDSLPKVKKWLDRNNFISSKYKVLVDEYHLLLEDMEFRGDAILGLMENIKHFEHYTFMSATPIAESFLPGVMESLPYTSIKWDKVAQLQPKRVKAFNVYQTTVLLIKEFLAGMNIYYDESEDTVKVEQLFIFLNSIKGIKQVIETAELSDDDVKVVCSNNVRNADILGNISISKVTDPNAPINFFTKKGFQGCNLFSNNGLVVVVSDGHKKHTLIDVSTTLHQIAGRLRTNSEYNNILKNHIWHIYSTTKLFRIDEEFSEEMKNIVKETETLANMYQKGTTDEKALLLKKDLSEDLLCYYSKDDDKYIYSEDKAKYMEYNHNLVNHIYSSGLSIRNAYADAGFMTEEDEFYRDDEGIILKKIATTSFKELLQQYIDLRKDGSNEEMIMRYELENPLFKPAYDQLGESGIKTCKWMESKITNKVIATSPDTVLFVSNEFHKQVGDDVFISKADAKKLLQSIYEKYDIEDGSPKISILAQSKWYTINEVKKRVNGKDTNGIILKAIRSPLTMANRLKKK
jgi:hypothetical protein